MKRLIAACALFGLGACTPPDPHAHAEENWRICESGTFENARVAACSTVIADTQADPQRRAAALVQRGIVRADNAQPDRAIADFGRALRLDAHNIDALIQRGAVHQGRGAFQTALQDFNAALAIDPTSPMALQRREAALAGAPQTYAVQLDQLNQILVGDPVNASALNGRCWLRATNNRDLDEALADCDASLRARPNDANTFDSRGLVHLQRGEIEAAYADYQAATGAEPQNGHFLYGRAIAEIRLGQIEKGNADLTEASRLDGSVAAEYAAYGVGPPAPPPT